MSKVSVIIPVYKEIVLYREKNLTKLLAIKEEK